MKNKFVIFLLTLTLFLFYFKGTAYGQLSDFLVPGVNCGIAWDIKTSKCCAPTKFDLVRAPDLGAPLNVVRDLVVGIIGNVASGVTDPLEDLQNKMLVPCQVGTPSTPGDPSNINCRCELKTTPTPGSLVALNSFCENQTSSLDKTNCSTCIKDGGVWTSIGCIQGSLNRFIGETVFGLGIGLAGGIALLCIIYAAFMMQSSQGNPEQLKKAQEMLTSCIMGLMLIIFSIFILRLIGVDILKIPGFL